MSGMWILISEFYWGISDKSGKDMMYLTLVLANLGSLFWSSFHHTDSRWGNYTLRSSEVNKLGNFKRKYKFGSRKRFPLIYFSFNGHFLLNCFDQSHQIQYGMHDQQKIIHLKTHNYYLSIIDVVVIFHFYFIK